MALMKWNKYVANSTQYFYNERSVYIPQSTYPTTDPYVTGYSGYSFSELSGFYGSGYGTYPTIAFNVYPAAVYALTLIEDGGSYFITVVQVATCDSDMEYSKGSFIEEVIAEEGTYPDDGVYGSYWYVKVGVGFPGIKMEVNNAIVTAIDGWTKIDNTLHKLTDFWGKIGESVKKAL